MALSQGRTFKAQLDAIYGVGADVEEQSSKSISRLRKRLKPHGIGIKMQRGLGYNLQVLA